MLSVLQNGKLKHHHKNMTTAFSTQAIINMFRIQKYHYRFVIQLQNYGCWINTHIFIPANFVILFAPIFSVIYMSLIYSHRLALKIETRMISDTEYSANFNQSDKKLRRFMWHALPDWCCSASPLSLNAVTSLLIVINIMICCHVAVSPVFNITS